MSILQPPNPLSAACLYLQTSILYSTQRKEATINRFLSEQSSLEQVSDYVIIPTNLESFLITFRKRGISPFFYLQEQTETTGSALRELQLEYSIIL